MQLFTNVLGRLLLFFFFPFVIGIQNTEQDGSLSLSKCEIATVSWVFPAPPRLQGLLTLYWYIDTAPYSCQIELWDVGHGWLEPLYFRIEMVKISPENVAANYTTPRLIWYS